jgi:hypothetical protein
MGLFSRKKKPTPDDIIFEHITHALDGTPFVESLAILMDVTKHLFSQVPVSMREELSGMMLQIVMTIAKPDEKEMGRILPEVVELDSQLESSQHAIANRVHQAVADGAIKAKGSNLGSIDGVVATYVSLILKSFDPEMCARGAAAYAQCLRRAAKTQS